MFGPTPKQWKPDGINPISQKRGEFHLAFTVYRLFALKLADIGFGYKLEAGVFQSRLGIIVIFNP